MTAMELDKVLAIINACEVPEMKLEELSPTSAAAIMKAVIVAAIRVEMGLQPPPFAERRTKRTSREE